VKNKERHLYYIALFVSLLVVFTPLSSFYVYATTTTASTSSSTSSTTTSTTTTTTSTTTTTTTTASTTTTSTTTTTLDTEPPSIGTILKITKNGEDVQYIGPNSISGVEITVEITEPTNPTVYFDLSAVGGSSSVPARVCTKSGTVWKCSLLDVTLMSPTGQISIDVSASDTAGNTATSTVTKTIQLDNLGPDVTFIGTDKLENSISYAKTAKNTLVVRLSETGAGINDNNIFLDLTQFNGMYSVQADNCTQGAVWACYWYNVNAYGRNSGDRLKIIVLPTSTDDVGNPASGLSEAEIVLDKEPPRLLNITITSVGSLGETEYHQSGDLLKIEANISDNESSVTAVADLSNLFMSGHDAEYATCTAYGSNSYTCQWTTDAIKTGYYKTIINFNLSDFVGNELLTTESIEVFETSEEIPNNFVLIVDEDEMLPENGVSRLTMSLIGNYLISVPFYVSGSNEVLRLTVDECKIENDTGLYTTYFQNQLNPDLARPATQSGKWNRVEFYFGYNGARFSSPQINGLDDFRVTCNLNIYQKQGNVVYPIPEIEKFEFEIDLRDSALGGPPGEVVADKIQQTKDNWLTESKWITDIYKFLDWAEFICRTGKSLVMMWQQFLVLENVGYALMKSPNTAMQAIGKPIFQAGCHAYEGLGGIFWTVWFGADKRAKGASKRCSVVSADNYIKPQPLPSQPTTIAEALKKSEGKFNMRWICGWATCEYGLLELSEYTGGNVINNILSGVDVGEEEDLNQFLRQRLHIHLDDSFNARNSILFSAASMCLPGVFYNLNKYRQINCKYISCLENVTTAGGDFSVCDEAKSQAWCLSFWGEVFEVIGPARVLGVLSQQIRGIFVNFIPVTLDNIFKSAVCEKTDQKNWAYIWFCDVPSVIYSAIDTYGRAAGIGAVFSIDKMFSKPDVEDVCAQVFPKNETSGDDSSTPTTTNKGGSSTITFGPDTTTTT